MTETLNTIVRIIAVMIELVAAWVLIPWIKSKVDEKKFDSIKRWVEVAVSAAEQLYKYEGGGVEKKAYVLEFLAKAGIELDAESLDALIEAAVFKLPQYFELDGDVIESEAAADGIPPEERREITVKI